jgi:2-phosphoglycerate kinase
VVDGFLEQTRDVLVGVTAAIDRALQEGWSMVLEGVHLVPGMLPPIENALVVQCVLAINDTEAHASHFWIRDTDSEGMRPYEKYLEAFDDIRLVQDYILGRAAKHGVPVVANGNIEEAIGEVMELVLNAAEPLRVRG